MHMTQVKCTVEGCSLTSLLTKWDLEEHMDEKHRPHKCGECDSKFQSLTGLSKHYNIWKETGECLKSDKRNKPKRTTIEGGNQPMQVNENN